MKLPLLPTRRQWKRWSLKTRLAAVGTYAGTLSLLVALVAFAANHLGPSRSTVRLSGVDPTVLPEAYLSLSILPIRESDLEAVWFLSGQWALSELPTSHETDVYQSVAAFRLVLASQMPSGTPDLLIDRLGLQIVARRPLTPRPRIHSYVFRGGGADGPISFADFETSPSSFWPLRWRREAENEAGYASHPVPLTFKYLRAGENVVILVSEAPAFTGGNPESPTQMEEQLLLVARADLLLASRRIAVVSNQALRLVRFNMSPKDTFENLETISRVQQLQDASMVSSFWNTDLSKAAVSKGDRGLFAVLGHLNGVGNNRTVVAELGRQGVEAMKNPPGDLGDRELLKDLVSRLGAF